MFRGLRLRLTLLYLFAALALIALVGTGTYRLVDSYLVNITDLGLQHKMAHEFRNRGITLPPELAHADQEWYSSRGTLAALPPTAVPTARRGDGEDHDGDNGGDALPANPPANPPPDSTDADLFNGELAAIYVLPLDATGGIVAGAAAPAGIQADVPAEQAALATGTDWRTILIDGSEMRLLTYRLPPGQTAAAVQVGQPLEDQNRVLQQLLSSLLGLGAVAAVLLGLGSWGLAGRALRPAQQAWERQQTFVANASHELRTPLTLMRASAEVARRSLPSDDADNRELLGDVLQETDHMSRLVEDLLLLSRLDAGRLPVAHELIPLADLLGEVQRQVGRLAADRGISLETTEAGGTVTGDATRLRQVLLISARQRHAPHAGRRPHSGWPPTRPGARCRSAWPTPAAASRPTTWRASSSASTGWTTRAAAARAARASGWPSPAA